MASLRKCFVARHVEQIPYSTLVKQVGSQLASILPSPVCNSPSITSLSVVPGSLENYAHIIFMHYNFYGELGYFHPLLLPVKCKY